MTNRRSFLQSTAALSALPLAARTQALGRLRPGGQGDAELPGLVVWDQRFAQAQRFSDHFLQAGIPGHAINADITELWQRGLRALWQGANPMPIRLYGMTEAPALFMLERLAWDAGHRLAIHAEHIVPEADALAVEHLVHQCADGHFRDRLMSAGGDWARHMASCLADGADHLAVQGLPSDTAMPDYSADAVHLHSWVIAPVRHRHRQSTVHRGVEA